MAAELVKSGIDLTIDVVGLSVDDPTRQQLQCIAREGQGRYYDAGNATEITEALTQVAKDRDIRPFGLTGAPITGGATPESAPAVAAGSYIDQIPATGEQAGRLTRYYRLRRTSAGTELTAAAFLVAVPGEMKTQLVGGQIVLHLLKAGKKCELGGGVWSDQTRESLPLFAVGIRTTRSYLPPDCGSGPEITVKVDLIDLDLTAARELQLTFGEWPSVASSYEQFVEFSAQPPLTFAPEPPANLATGGDLVEGGSSLVGATLVRPNTVYTARIVPGEIQTFALPLSWGQAARVGLAVPALRGEVAAALGNDKLHVGGFALSATGAQISFNHSSGEVVPEGQVYQMLDFPSPVLALGLQNKPASQPGLNHYVFALSPHEALAGVEFEYHFVIEVIGKLMPPPEYEQSLPSASTAPSRASSPDPTAASPAVTESGPSADLTDGSNTSVRWPMLILIATGLIAAGTALLVARRRARIRVAKSAK